MSFKHGPDWQLSQVVALSGLESLFDGLPADEHVLLGGHATSGTVLQDDGAFKRKATWVS